MENKIVGQVEYVNSNINFGKGNNNCVFINSENKITLKNVKINFSGNNGLCS